MAKRSTNPSRGTTGESPDLTSESESSSSSDSDGPAIVPRCHSSTLSSPRRRSAGSAATAAKDVDQSPKRGSLPGRSTASLPARSSTSEQLSSALASKHQDPAVNGSPKRVTIASASSTRNPPSGPSASSQPKRRNALIKSSKSFTLENDVNQAEMKCHAACEEERHKAFVEELQYSAKVRFIRKMFDEKLADVDWATGKSLGELMDQIVDHLVSTAWERIRTALDIGTGAAYAQVEAEKQTQISKEMQVGYVKEVTLMRDKVDPKRSVKVETCEIELWEPLNDLDHVTRALVVACVEEKLKGVIPSSTGESFLLKERELQRHTNEAQKEVTRLQQRCRELEDLLFETQTELEETTMNQRKSEALLALARAGISESEPNHHIKETKKITISRRPSLFGAKRPQSKNSVGMMCLASSAGTRSAASKCIPIPKRRSKSICVPRGPSTDEASVAGFSLASRLTSTVSASGDTTSRRPSMFVRTPLDIIPTSENLVNYSALVDTGIEEASRMSPEVTIRVPSKNHGNAGQRCKFEHGCVSTDEYTRGTEESGVASEALSIESLFASDSMGDEESRRQILAFMSKRERTEMAFANDIDQTAIVEALIDDNPKQTLFEIIAEAEHQSYLSEKEEEEWLTAQEEQRRDTVCRLRSCRRAARESRKDRGTRTHQTARLSALECSELILERNVSDGECGPVSDQSKLARKGPVLSTGKAGIGWRKSNIVGGAKPRQKEKVLLGIGVAFERERQARYLIASPSSCQETRCESPVIRTKNRPDSRCAISTPTSGTADSLPSARASTPGAADSLTSSRVSTSESIFSAPFGRTFSAKAHYMGPHMEVTPTTCPAAVRSSLPDVTKSLRAVRISQKSCSVQT